ncbi:MAG: S-methyl-5-thioribose-1-phosphate isomerase [bacterium]|nr:S-methyl-5-thioribose-1-phosphate isomerase [bacterium]
MTCEVFPVRWEDGKVVMIDQTLLPVEYRELSTDSVDELAEWIENMVVRGAPAIGVAAAYGMALAAMELRDKSREEFDLGLAIARDRLARTRPTAVNLFWALERMMSLAESQALTKSSHEMVDLLLEEAKAIQHEDYERCKTIGKFGAELLPDEGGVLTHCNAGALATAGYGTAVGVLRAAWEMGKKIHVYSGETRPRLQGAKLTCWELKHLGIPFTMITDSMAGYFMQQGKIIAAVTGADRIASNGDSANKIGTYTVAVLCKEHNIPFYIAAPLSSVDFNCPDGSKIPIEERDREEVLDVIPGCGEVYADIHVANPAFDVTPARLITAIITDRGVAYPPFDKSLEVFRGE